MKLRMFIYSEQDEMNSMATFFYDNTAQRPDVKVNATDILRKTLYIHINKCSRFKNMAIIINSSFMKKFSISRAVRNS